MNVLHIITCLDQGGAETTLYRLVTHGNNSRTTVVSMTDEGVYGSSLRAAGVEVIALGMPSGRLTFAGIARLYRLLRQLQPDVVQTWMYHSNLVGGVIARISGCVNIVWGIHHFNLDPARTSLSARWAAYLCAGLSYLIPSAIICVAKGSAEVHQAIGYEAKKLVVIPNGYDLNYFVSNRTIGHSLRRQWNVADSTPLLGFIARWDPQKDHANLLEALVQVVNEGFDFRCALVGCGMLSDNTELMSLIDKHKLNSKIFLTGPSNDIPAVMNALDIHVLSSAGEAFPNVVAEAMACGVPCVVTDVGDAKMIAGDVGWCVPPENATALAGAIIVALRELSEGNWAERSFKCRQHITEHFSIEKMVEKYTAVWKTAVCKHGKSQFEGKV